MATRVRKSSDTWNYFTDLGSDKAKCNICSKQLSYKGGSTFNLTRHIRTMHPTVCSSSRRLTPASETVDLDEPEVGVAVLGANTSSLPTSTIATSADLPRRTQSQEKISSYMHRPLPGRKSQEIDFALLETIVKNYLPFQIVESVYFQKYCRLLNNSYTLPPRKAISTVLTDKLYDITKGKIMQQLEKAEAVTISTDGWTSINNDCYLSVTAHYLGEDMEMKSSLLECFKYDDKHTAENLCNELKHVTLEWKIQNKIVAIVTDNAANIIAAVRLTGWRHVPCFAHTLNLIVRSGLECLKELCDKVKSIVEFFRRSPQATGKLKATQL